MLAAAMTMLPTAWAVAVVNVAAGLITVWLVMRLGEMLGLGRWRFIAGLMTAGNPLLLNALPQPMTEVVFTALATAWWFVLVAEFPQTSARFVIDRNAWRVLRIIQPLCVGGLFGFAALCRPTIWPLAGLMAVAWVVHRWTCESNEAVVERSPPHPNPLPRRGGEGTGKLAAYLFVIGTVFVVAHWIVRNQVVFGRPIVTTTHGGYTLLLANNPVHDAEVVEQPWGATWPGESLERWQRELAVKIHDEIGPDADEWTEDQWMSRQANDYIREHADRFLAAAWHRVRSLWAILPRGEGTHLPSALRGSIAAFFACEFFLAVIGMWIIVRRGEWPAWLPGLLLIVTVQGVHLIYWTDTRMRTPLEPVLALLAARACCMLFSRGKEAQG
jgi:hypothetical protein